MSTITATAPATPCGGGGWYGEDEGPFFDLDLSCCSASAPASSAESGSESEDYCRAPASQTSSSRCSGAAPRRRRTRSGSSTLAAVVGGARRRRRAAARAAAAPRTSSSARPAERRRLAVRLRQARQAAHAQLRVRQGRVLRRPRQLLQELQQRALGQALRRVRLRLSGPGGRGQQEDALAGRDQAVPQQDLEATAPGSPQRRRGPPATEEPVGVRGADGGVPVAAASPRRLAPRAAGRHRERHRALQGVAPPWYAPRATLSLVILHFVISSRSALNPDAPCSFTCVVQRPCQSSTRHCCGHGAIHEASCTNRLRILSTKQRPPKKLRAEFRGGRRDEEKKEEDEGTFKYELLVKSLKKRKRGGSASERILFY